MRLALAQINTTIGDFAGNAAKIRAAASRAREAGADVLLLPELATCGYPPLDLLERPSFVATQRELLVELARESGDLAIVTGALVDAPSAQGGQRRHLHNAAVVLRRGAMEFVQPKTLLPTYDVFDEARYFQPASERRLLEIAGRRVGLAVCEDVWSGAFWGDQRPYPTDPVSELVAAGAELILVMSASPWSQGRIALREQMVADAARVHGVPFAFLNLVGANDELVFDGASFTTDAAGRVTGRLARFEEDWRVVDPFAGQPVGEAGDDDVALLESALVLGIRDYLDKLGFGKVVVGLSGGIDSSVTAYLATRALGPENVLGVLMPGPFSSEHSVADAEELARNLGIEARSVRIDPVYKVYLEQLSALFGARESYGLTQENLQARIRGALLMAVSNFENRLVLSTGNKSELAVGYTTLYGDLIGGLGVLGDVLKRDVYRIARAANAERVVVPWGSIEKPPSAELAPDQRDSDSLPDYDVLDSILEQVLERGVAAADVRAPQGTDRETVQWVLRAIDRNEYKRRQAPIVLRVSGKAFGSGRRLPIVQRSGWGA